MTAHYDILIVGSGIVGSVAALALSKNTSLKIAVIESQNISFPVLADVYDHRVSAISLASQRILQQIAVWPLIASKRLTPYTHMSVWDENGSGKIDFDCTDVCENALGYIIEDSVMRSSLLEKISASDSIDLIYPARLASLQKKSDCVELVTHDGKIVSTKLLIAADGANSWVREQAGIELKTHDYEQTAIVATVQTTLPHQHTAWQRFLTTGPLAFLPLNNVNTCSIVWSVTPDYADELLAMDDRQFTEKLTLASEKKLGDIIQVSKRYSFPLRMRHAKKYVEERIALIGDAAHTLHPLAGQGVNLGILDAVSLAEVVGKAFQKNRDFSSFFTLRKYERSRKSDNLTMLAMVDVLKKLFMHQNTLVQNARNRGLDLVGRVDFMRNMLARYAVGNRDDLPVLP